MEKGKIGTEDERQEQIMRIISKIGVVNHKFATALLKTTVMNPDPTEAEIIERIEEILKESPWAWFPTELRYLFPTITQPTEMTRILRKSTKINQKNLDNICNDDIGCQADKQLIREMRAIGRNEKATWNDTIRKTSPLCSTDNLKEKILARIILESINKVRIPNWISYILIMYSQGKNEMKNSEILALKSGGDADPRTIGDPARIITDANLQVEIKPSEKGVTISTTKGKPFQSTYTLLKSWIDFSEIYSEKAYAQFLKKNEKLGNNNYEVFSDWKTVFHFKERI